MKKKMQKKKENKIQENSIIKLHNFKIFKCSNLYFYIILCVIIETSLSQRSEGFVCLFFKLISWKKEEKITSKVKKKYLNIFKIFVLII